MEADGRSHARSWARARVLRSGLPWHLCVLSPLGDPRSEDTACIFHPSNKLVCLDPDSDCKRF